LVDFYQIESESLKKVLRSVKNLKHQRINSIAKEGDSLAAQTISSSKSIRRFIAKHRNSRLRSNHYPNDITNFVPVTTAKDSDLYVTQFDNSVVESAGLLKMDFLGLKTLTLIKDTVKLVKYRTGKQNLDPDNFPIDDVKTYELFQRGETVGIFNMNR
jgi:DNA polymerase-3 subunit alpha